MNIIIDGANLANIAWFGSPLKSFEEYPDTDKNDEEIEQAFLLNLLHRISTVVNNITHGREDANTIICWDSASSVRLRRGAFSEYKKNRQRARQRDKKEYIYPVRFIDKIIPKIKKVHKKFGIKYNQAEADDLMAILCTALSGEDIYVVTTDQDLYQVVTDTTNIYNPRTSQFIDKHFVKRLLNVTPKQIVDYKSLCGDPSDNYPGLRGVGPKTAVKHINNKTVFGATDSAKIALFKELATVPYPKLKVNKILHLLISIDFHDSPNWGRLLEDTKITPYDIKELYNNGLM